jgi:hypothetical protein
MDSLQRKGALEGSLEIMNQKLAPLLVLYAVQETVFSEEKDSVWYKTFVGKSGLPGWAPIKAITSTVDGSILQPPLIGAVTEGLTAAVKLDGPAFVKSLNNTMNAFMPGSGLLRFLTEDLRVMMGEEPMAPGPIGKLKEVLE